MMQALSKKTFLLVLFLLLIIGLVLVLKIRFLQKAENKLVDSNKLTLDQSNNNNPSFQIISISDLKNPLKPFDQIEITFSEEIDKEGILIKIEPEVAIVINDPGAEKISIHPLTSWSFGSNYKIKFFKKSLSKSLVELDRDYEYTFNVVDYHSE